MSEPLSTIMTLDGATEAISLAYRYEVIGLEQGLFNIVCVLSLIAFFQLVRLFLDFSK